MSHIWFHIGLSLAAFILLVEAIYSAIMNRVLAMIWRIFLCFFILAVAGEISPQPPSAPHFNGVPQ